VRFALGAQYRREGRASNVSHEGNQLEFGFLLGNADARGQRDISAGYLELLWPFYDGIELQTAGRVEHYENTADAASPSVGLLVTPSEIVGREKVASALRRLRLRGTATSAFRAPSIYESLPGFLTSIQQFD